MKHLLILATCILASTACFAQEELSPAKAMELGRKYTAALYTDDTATLWPAMTPEMKDAMQDEATLRDTNRKIMAQLGKETKLIKEVGLPNQQYLMYTRLVEMANIPVKAVVKITFARDAKIAGFFITPESNPAESTHLDYKDKAIFTLPVSAEWTVYQGGRTMFDNYHAAAPDQRFAYDLMVIKNAWQYANKGWDLSDYYSYGLPVLAPAAGTVVIAIDQYEDNPPMHPSKDNPAYGNTIVIDHGNNEFSMLAHLKPGSVKVKVGDKVTAGQQIALCGNSGNSPLPHLHYHLQTTSAWFKGEGLPIQFHDYISNGKPVAVGEPARGEVLQPK
jgi:murein DD-endopeptidase MepM/ murein hydrolase activator NlpD